MPETFGAQLRRLRRDRGLTQRQLAERSALTWRSISRIENDEQMPSRSSRRNLAKALGVPRTTLSPQ